MIREKVKKSLITERYVLIRNLLLKTILNPETDNQKKKEYKDAYVDGVLDFYNSLVGTEESNGKEIEIYGDHRE